MLIWALVGMVLIGVMLIDAFETVVLPRRATRKLRIARLVLLSTWYLWSAPARGLWRSGERRETYLSYFGPLALLLLFVVWVAGLIGGFALLLWGLRAPLVAGGGTSFWTTLYGSGTTFFTLGLGDVLPHTSLGRLLVTLEAGLGFGFLALIISYMPVLTQAFSQREVNVSLLDARAGSPPTAAELLRRHAGADFTEALAQLFREGERWSAELLESHLSYPLLAYYRSQHEQQSWLAGLTMILDATALLQVGIDGAPTRSARLAFAMARHAAADLSHILGTRPSSAAPARLPAAELARLRTMLVRAGVPLREGPDADRMLGHLRQMYEPFVNALAERLLMPLPPWMPPPGARDDAWKITAWGPATRSPEHDETDGT
ncbi:MAG TPA: potassium channel family protein [Candidatus Methylomirabilis sp.]|nr:potassium channel family protein [Candidatus Methylomirabilis sp.]